MNGQNETRDRGVCFSVLLPHAPILVPLVAGDRLKGCTATVRAMEEAARRLVAQQPETVILVSPHAPRDGTNFGLTFEPLSGSLAAFGAPQVSVSFPDDAVLAAAVREEANRRGVPTQPLSGAKLDHGSVVPLWYLAQAGWQGPTLVIALNYQPEKHLAEFGSALAAAVRSVGRRAAVVASGDMSHRLIIGAPAGFHPQAIMFDTSFIDQLRAGAARELTQTDARLRDIAAEDVVDSTVLAVAASTWRTEGREVLGYEGPFGVGYGVAVLFVAPTATSPLPALARQSIAAAFAGGPTTPPEGVVVPTNGTGVFVTLHDADGRLRGCIGNLGMRSADLVAETWRMAREAAFHDGRFSPLRAAELAGLHIDVTVLQPLQDVRSVGDLDPQRWGVVVSAADGRRGVLLPGIPEITNVAEQLAIARRKAGIGLAEPVRLQRFAAECFAEARPGAPASP